MAAHVERGQQRRDETNRPQRRALVHGRGQNLVLRKEPRERWDTGDGQPAHDERARRDGHELAQVAVVAHVLVVMHSVDDRTRTQEQQGLEEGMGDHVEDRGHVCAGPDGQEHVAQLADRRVCQHLLDVVLRDGDGGGEQGRSDSHPGNHRHHPR